MTSFKDIPKTEHFVIITTSTIYIPGDERSRTNPGHGYSESTETVINYEAFTDRKKWESQIEYLTKQSSKSFKAFLVKPVEIETKVVIKINV